MDEYKEDAENYIKLVNEFHGLHDTEYDKAYAMHKMALAQYERWSFILLEVRKHEIETKTKKPALKDRIEHVMRTLNNIYTSSRMVWSKAKNDLNQGKC